MTLKTYFGPSLQADLEPIRLNPRAAGSIPPTPRDRHPAGAPRGAIHVNDHVITGGGFGSPAYAA